MIVSELTELRVVGVFDRGKPHKECIAIQVNQALNIGQYGIMLGHHVEGNGAIPYCDQLYWFGGGWVKAGDWIFVYTSSGEPRQTPQQNGVNCTYTVYWGRPATMFAHTSVVPMLFRVDAVDILLPVGDQLQSG